MTWVLPGWSSTHFIPSTIKIQSPPQRVDIFSSRPPAKCRRPAHGAQLNGALKWCCRGHDTVRRFAGGYPCTILYCSCSAGKHTVFSLDFQIHQNGFSHRQTDRLLARFLICPARNRPLRGSGSASPPRLGLQATPTQRWRHAAMPHTGCQWLRSCASPDGICPR